MKRINRQNVQTGRQPRQIVTTWTRKPQGQQVKIQDEKVSFGDWLV